MTYVLSQSIVPRQVITQQTKFEKYSTAAVEQIQENIFNEAGASIRHLTTVGDTIKNSGQGISIITEKKIIIPSKKQTAIGGFYELSKDKENPTALTTNLSIEIDEQEGANLDKNLITIPFIAWGIKTAKVEVIERRFKIIGTIRKSHEALSNSKRAVTANETILFTEKRENAFGNNIDADSVYIGFILYNATLNNLAMEENTSCEINAFWNDQIINQTNANA